MRTKKKKPPNRPPRPPERHTVPAEFWIVEAEAASDFRFLTAAAEGDEPAANRLRRFSMTAYTGGKLLLAGFEFPVVVDLSGLKVSAKSRPILRDHNPAQIVGHTETIEINGSTLRLLGVLSAANAHAGEVAQSADNGFPWQASIGAVDVRVSFVDVGETVEVNGRRFTGPLYVARQSVLREVSFVALGADDQTSARMAAATAGNQRIEVMMLAFETWAEEKGFQAEALSPEQAESLRAWWTQQTADPPAPVLPEPAVPGPTDDNADPPVGALTAGDPPPAPITGAAIPGSPSPTNLTPQLPLSPVDELRAQWAAERRRIAKISQICGTEFPEIAAQAVEQGWNETQTELAVLKAARPKGPVIHTSGPRCTVKILEAAACLSAGIAEAKVLAEYGEQTIEAAQPFRQIGLKELVAECARLEGYTVPRVFGDGKETIRAGFSTVSLPGILENVMNKTMLAAYEVSPIAAFQLCAVGSVSDFKEVSRYRLLGTGGFEKVAPDGELKHGKLGEHKYAQLA